MKNLEPATEGKSSNQPGEKRRLITQATEVLRGETLPLDEILDLAKKLKKYKSFTYARRLLARAVEHPAINDPKTPKLKIYQEWALATYKDDDLPVDDRLDDALKILTKIENFKTTKNQETLGLIGAIYKRKWEVDSNKAQLERSLLYYRRGYAEGAEKDQGYTGINTAFVLDWLAFQEEKEASEANEVSKIAADRREKAKAIREDIIEKVTPLTDKSWWYYSTLAEAYFGLKNYDMAVKCFNSAKENIGSVPEWEAGSAIQQLARLADIQSKSGAMSEQSESSPAWQALIKIFGDVELEAVRSAFIGKIGLGMSGGGFRASLFHIGTLAKLAELDVLRYVEVLSCVSGGSIIGAHYYLKVRQLLQNKTDAEITREDYIQLVEEVCDEFLAGVQRNIIIRVAAEFTTNLKLVFTKASRTKRIGELYEEEIFSRINDGEGDRPRYMDELNIYPKGAEEGFNPKRNNWKRSAKVPILVLNAASLNTGHNWQFTTGWMGENPSGINAAIDANDQLRRLYYDEAPPEFRKIRLGYAVAASACVPALFDPLSLEGLYPDRIVRLVDGGVCDNQGVSSLLEQDCNVILISDGSGQMTSELAPSAGSLGVFSRTFNIIQARVREAEYTDLEHRRRTSLLRGLMFIHLKEDLDMDPIDWVGCLDPIEKKPKRLLTTYGISKIIQEELASTRTQLDSFSDVEAYALMTSAYRMTDDAFKNKKCVDGFSDKGVTAKWKFLEVDPSLKGEAGRFDFVKKLLAVSSVVAFKIWKLLPSLKVTAFILAILAVAGVIYGFYTFADSPIPFVPKTIGGLGLLVVSFGVMALIGYLFGSYVVKTLEWRSTLVKIAIGIFGCLIGFIGARIHLLIFDKLYLKYGSIDSYRK